MLWGTGLTTSRAQKQLRAEITERIEDPRTQRVNNPSAPTSAGVSLKNGEAIGILKIPRMDLDMVVVEGVGSPELSKGPGHYPDTPLPGARGTTAIAGHRTTYGAPFRRIDRLRRGDRVGLVMPYGTFTYRVERTRIVPPTATWVTRRVAHDRLVLSACHPLYSAARRIIVFARLVDARPRGTLRA